MKKAEYPIVVIDEEMGQLDEMTNALKAVELNCMPIQYDAMYQDEAYIGIELLFLDVNLNPGAGQSDNTIYSYLADAIMKYISLDNGPYVLIFWTTRPELIDGFKTYVNRDKTSSIYQQRPIYIATLPKDDFIAQPKESIDSIMNKPIVKLVFSLNKKLQEASVSVFKDLLGCVPLPELWGDAEVYIQNLKNMFTKIAVASVGKQNAVGIPDKAIFEVVGKEVTHHLIKNAGNEWKDFLEINSTKAESAKKTTNQEWQYHLNTALHIETGIVDKIQRGAILRGKKWEFDTLLGMDLNEWCKKEFGLDQTHTDNSNIIPVALEISPACDYAQGQSRLCKYLLGLCRISKDKPSKRIETNEREPFKKLNRHVILPTFFKDNKYYKMVFSFNFAVGLTPTVINKFDLLFVLRDEIVTFVTSSAAAYCSRIGIINVNES